MSYAYLLASTVERGSESPSISRPIATRTPSLIPTSLTLEQLRTITTASARQDHTSV